MQLSETVKLYMTKQQKVLIVAAMKEYINTVNSLVYDAANGTSITKYTSADVKANLPSALKNQCIRDSKSIVRKYSKACRGARCRKGKSGAKVPVLKRLCCNVNNQNYRIRGDFVEFPVLVDGRCKRLSVKARMTDEQKSRFARSRLGTMSIVCKNNKIVAQIVYEKEEPDCNGEGQVMGVDLGIKCPAVSHTTEGSVRFYGNGRKNKYMRRHYAAQRKRLQKSKKIKALKRLDDKEQRIMRDTDHKISRDIVTTAVSHGVKVIKLERLANIRSTTRTSRKNNHSLHNWSFYRLAQFIE